MNHPFEKIKLGALLFLASVLCMGGELLVLCSLPAQQESIRRVGGEFVDVRSVLPTGASPETYSPSAREITSFAKAQLLFLIGVPMETPLVSRLKKAFPSLRQVDTTQVMQMRPDDPHCWLDVNNMIAHTQCVCQVLEELCPEQKDQFRKNAEEYIAELKSLLDDLRKCFADCQGQAIVAWHPAYGYLLEPFGIRQIAVEEEGKTPGARHLVELRRETASLPCRSLLAPPQANRRQVKNACKTLQLKEVQTEVIPAEYLSGMKKLVETIREQFPKEEAK